MQAHSRFVKIEIDTLKTKCVSWLDCRCQINSLSIYSTCRINSNPFSENGNLCLNEQEGIFFTIRASYLRLCSPKRKYYKSIDTFCILSLMSHLASLKIRQMIWSTKQRKRLMKYQIHVLYARVSIQEQLTFQTRDSENVKTKPKASSRPYVVTQLACLPKCRPRSEFQYCSIL